MPDFDENVAEENSVPYSTRELEVIKKENLKRKKNFYIAIVGLSTLIYLLSLIYGITRVSDPSFSSQAVLIMLQSIGGMMIPLAFPIVEKLFRLRLNTPARIGVLLFAFAGIILGETFEFYYNVANWDKILHGLSGVGITLFAYSLCASWIKDKEDIKNKTAITIIFALLASCSIAMIWELYEHTIDMIAGTNMQKIMPENFLFNGGDTHAVLNGSVEEIASFYQNPEGYSYALQDTMGDMTIALIGSILFIAISQIVNKLVKKDVFQNVVEILPRSQI